jgi:hypothetical protein
VLDIADDADDLALHVFGNRQLHALADRLFARKKFAREGFVDDQNLRRLSPVALGEGAASDEGDAHRAEVVGGDDARVGGQPLAGPGRRPAFDDDGVLPHAIRERERRDRADRAHAGL